MSDTSSIPPQTITTGLLAAFVGFASSFAIVIQGLIQVGASPDQAASGLFALNIGTFLGSACLRLA